MRKKISGELLDRYLRGECSLAEKEFVKSWYQSFNQDDDRISDMDEIEKQLLRDRMFGQITNNLADDAAFTGTGKVVRLTFLKYAAVAAAAMVIIAYFLWPSHNSKPQLASNAPVIISNTGKNIREQKLGDGSHVWLSPGARITYSKDFGSKNRELSMSGEAFFEVTKNPQKPFIINSGHIVTEVWGTSFRVRDTRQASFADVAVVTGKVSVSLPGVALANINKPIPANTASSVMIYPDQHVTYTNKDNALHAAKEKQADLKLWKKNNLSFDNATVKDVIPLLSKTFGLNIHSDSKTIDDYYITADFNDLNFPQIMEVLRNTLNINYEINGNNVLLTKNQTN